jgi:MoaE-MoaD fusion protein
VAMKVRVRLFASYREAVGAPTVDLALDDAGGGEAVWAELVARYPALARLPAPSGYAINDEYVDGLRPLRENDEVVLIPPVSGGNGAGGSACPPVIEITGGPIVVDRALSAVADPRAGAVVLFLGVVRDNARGRRVTRLEYEAYEALARREMEKIAGTIASRWPMTRVAIIHRTGHLKVGEASVAVSVSAPHRAEAFEAARFAIDTLKLTVPIWKKEIWESGEAWVGAEA